MALVVRGLNKHFGAQTALQEVSFTAAKGVTALLGANGSGKRPAGRECAGGQVLRTRDRKSRRSISKYTRSRRQRAHCSDDDKKPSERNEEPPGLKNAVVHDGSSLKSVLTNRLSDLRFL